MVFMEFHGNSSIGWICQECLCVLISHRLMDLDRKRFIGEKNATHVWHARTSSISIRESLSSSYGFRVDQSLLYSITPKWEVEYIGIEKAVICSISLHIKCTAQVSFGRVYRSLKSIFSTTIYVHIVEKLLKMSQRKKNVFLSISKSIKISCFTDVTLHYL